MPCVNTHNINVMLELDSFKKEFDTGKYKFFKLDVDKSVWELKNTYWYEDIFRIRLVSMETDANKTITIEVPYGKLLLEFTPLGPLAKELFKKS